MSDYYDDDDIPLPTDDESAEIEHQQHTSEIETIAPPPEIVLTPQIKNKQSEVEQDTSVMKTSPKYPSPPTNQTDGIAFYKAFNLPITPVKPTEKKGKMKGWSTPGHVVGPNDFKPGDNIGVLNGTEPTPNWYFHDADIDANSDQARKICELILPKTGWWYGRAGKPRSHASYLVAKPLRARKYVGMDGKSILELRGITQKKTYTLSVGPGSIHTSGEPIRFDEPMGPIGRVDDGDNFEVLVQCAAIGIILAQSWPATGRHNLRLAFAKLFLEYGISKANSILLLESVMIVTGSDKADVQPSVQATYDALKTGHATVGASLILEQLGEPILKSIASILRIAVSADDGTNIDIGVLTTTMIDRAWTKVVGANEPPGVFRRENEVLILRDSNNTCLNSLYEEQVKLEEPSQLQHVSGFRKIEVDTFREIVGRMVPCIQKTPQGTKTSVYPSRDFANLMLASPALPLPEPIGFSPIPFFTPEGLLVTTPGFHRATGMFYQPIPGFQMPDVADIPTQTDLYRSVSVLDEMVWQFPFKGRQGRHPYMDLREGCDWRQTASFANMLAFPLTILMRSLFHAVPLFLVDKPTTRTGASLMVQCWCYTLTGAWPSEAEWDGNESERRKFLTAILITGAPIIFLDEVKDLKSPDLNKILTGKNARIGRVLGSTEITNPRNFSTFVATGNNPAFPKDMAGRMCRVRLDTLSAKPSDRSGWEKDLMTWVPEHRMDLLAALYTIAKAWIAAKRPAHPDARVLNGFEPWSFAIGGALYNAGITEFLANKRDVEEDAESDDEDEVGTLLESWFNQYPDQIVTTASILKLEGLPSTNGVPWTGRQLGAWIRHNRDRRHALGDGVEVYIKKEQGDQHWKLKVLNKTESFL